VTAARSADKAAKAAKAAEQITKHSTPRAGA